MGQTWWQQPPADRRGGWYIGFTSSVEPGASTQKVKSYLIVTKNDPRMRQSGKRTPPQGEPDLCCSLNACPISSRLHTGSQHGAVVSGCPGAVIGFIPGNLPTLPQFLNPWRNRQIRNRLTSHCQIGAQHAHTPRCGLPPGSVIEPAWIPDSRRIHVRIATFQNRQSPHEGTPSAN